MDDTATHDATEPTPPAAEPTGAEPDPFAEIPSDPLGEGELPPGVAPGSLGGENPSAEQAERDAQAAAEAEADAAPPEEPLAEEPMGGEFLEEPPEPDDLAAEPEPEPDAAPPVAEEPTPEPEVEQPPVEEPVAGTDDTPPTEPATPVEGSGGSPLRGDPLGSDGADVPPPDVPPAAEPDAEPEPPADDPPPAPPVESEPPAETPAAAEPEPEPKPAKRKRKPRKKKAEKGRRGYVILRLSDRTESVVDGPSYPIWVEAFQREIPLGEEGSEPVTIDTRSGEMALRNAYRQLTENGEASMELVAIPAKLFNPKKVEGKVPDNALTIKVQ